MPPSEAMLDALAEVMVRESRVMRAESALMKAKRELRASLARLEGITGALPAGAELPPKVNAALQLREELPPATAEVDGRSLRQRIVEVMEKSPNEIHTSARIAPLIGATNRNSVRNTLLVLAARGKIKKVGEGQYQAEPREALPPQSS